MIPMRRLATTLLAISITACAAGAAQPGAAQPSAPEPVASSSSLQPSEGFENATITLSDGNEQIRMPVWVAADAAGRQRGLMGRESIPSNAGMLFVFNAPTVGGFWMKNTLIPLSIAFIDQDGHVLQILDMQPCTADPCETYTPDPSSPYLYALEANLGYFEEHGIGPGWTVDLDDALQGTQ